MSEKYLHIEPRHYYRLSFLFSMLGITAFMIAVAINKSEKVECFKYISIGFLTNGFFVLLLLLEDTAFELNNYGLTVKYTFWGFLIKPKLFKYDDILMIKIGKYAHQKGPPGLRIYLKNGKRRRYLIDFIGEDKGKLLPFIAAFRERNILVEYIGDYFYSQATQESSEKTTEE